MEKAFETAMKELDDIILDKNKTFDEVRKDLHFPSRILDMPITVSWEVDNYEVIKDVYKRQEYGSVYEMMKEFIEKLAQKLNEEVTKA